MIRRKNFSVSVLKSFLFGFPGLGTKFRFLFKSLNSFCVNVFLERFITYLFGSLSVFVFSLITDF